MRKTAGLLIAFALLIPVGIMAAAPSGAAAGAGCKAITGVATFKPALPVITSKATVNTTVTIVSHLTGCTGPGGASGVATSTTKLTKANCLNVTQSLSASKPATQSVKWVKGQTSTATASLKPNGKSLQSTLVSSTTAGLYKGTKLTGTLQGSLVGGACTAKPMTTFPFKSIGKLVAS